MSVLGVLTGGTARRRIVRWLVPAVIALVGVAQPTAASATGAAVESFTINGTWNCTSGCSLTDLWGISGSSTICEETEAEDDFGIDIPVPRSCNVATFSGNVLSKCDAALCTESGVVSFYIPDASDPGLLIGPIPVLVTGTAAIVNNATERAYLLTASFHAADTFEYPPGLLDFAAAGDLVGGGCDGAVAACIVNRAFDISVTGDQVDK